jgi:hypothetical protein
MAAKNFKVKIVKDHGGLDEEISGKEGANPISHGDLKKLKRKELKKKYRENMKDLSRYSKSHMADSSHLALVMKKNNSDDVVFVCFEPFMISFIRDPEVDDDPDGPDAPFVDGDGTATVVAASRFKGSNPAGEQFEAGPFKVNADADKQLFYKYSVYTVSGLSLDPCIITE